jgi:hypothetical protein
VSSRGVATANASPAKRKKVSLLECALASSGRAKSDRDRTQVVVSKPCCFLRFAEGILLLLGPCSGQSTALEEDDKVVRKKKTSVVAALIDLQQRRTPDATREWPSGL